MGRDASGGEMPQLDLQLYESGVLLPVRAKAAAKKNAITGFFSGSLKVSVTTAPEKGKANKAIMKLLSKELGISAKYIFLHSGGTSSEKKFVIEDFTVEQISAKVAELKI